MTESERVSIPYLTVQQVADMAGFKSRAPVYAACDSGELKVLNKKSKDAKKFERKLDPQSVHFWLEELKIREERAAAEQKAKEEKKSVKTLKLRGAKDGESQLDRIERKIDQLMKDWS